LSPKTEIYSTEAIDLAFIYAMVRTIPPDLRNRFVYGASPQCAVGTYGGEATHTLTVAEMPNRSHVGYTDSAGGHTHVLTAADANFGGGGANRPVVEPGTGDCSTHQSTSPIAWSGEHNHKITQAAAGGNGAHNNIPPFVALRYVMQIL
jgi:microcystin-dependent protein